MRLTSDTIFCLVIMAGLLFSSAVAEAQEADISSQPEMSADALLARQTVLLAKMLERPADLDIAFEYATVSVMVGDYEAAISTFERMLIFAPNLPRVKLELGVLYYRLGSFETARYYFQSTLETPNVPDEVRQRVETYLSAIASKQQPTQFRADVIIGARYQSNANAAPGGRRVTLNGRDFILDDTATGQADINAFVAGRAYGSYDLGTQGDLIETDVVFYAARFADQVRLDTGLAEITLGPSFNMARFNFDDVQLGIYGVASGVRLNHANYNGALGVGTRLVARPDIQTEINAKLEWRQRWFNDTSEYPTVSDRNGYFVQFASKISRQLTKGLQMRVLALADFEETRIKSQQSWEAGGGVGATYQFASPVKQLPHLWSIDLEAGYIYRAYDEPDPLVNAAVKQRDHEGWLRAALNVPLKYNVSAGLVGEVRRQNSNYDLSSYSNVSAMFSLRKAF
ncbi:tetratricopeptide repeat protein [Roseibium sp.]|uniref:tetratricopeptide repeat protein n=1 Tax=Roseibium sp. TaxID=1936156 RepID=UPI003BAAB55F